MGFFKRMSSLIGLDGAQRTTMWNSLNEASDVDEVFKKSFEKPQVILKHSTRCTVSFFAKRNVESPLLWDDKDADLYIVDVIGNRKLSKYVAEKTGFSHESPQMFIINEGEIIWSGTHENVNSANVKRVFSKLKED